MPLIHKFVEKSVKEPSNTDKRESVMVSSITVLRVGDIVSLSTAATMVGSVLSTTDAIT
jgi:hypothetical protein